MRPVPDISPSLLRLLHRSWSGSRLTPAEQAALQAWLDASPRHREVYAEIISGQWPRQDWKMWNEISVEDNWSRLQQKIRPSIPQRRFPYRLVAAAAAVLLLIGTGIYLWPHRKAQQVVTTPVDVAPGKEGAVLVLADGTQVVLDSAGNGVIARQQGANAVMQNGKLVYEHSNDKGTLVYNTMRTPRGRQFQLTLPDGTRVWLNAASSIRFPTTFEGTTRQIELSGEAYFEVTASASQPFLVHINNKAVVEVLGTNFNINAYTDEPIWRTTLLQGKVRVKLGERAVPILPGQQAEINTDIHIKDDVDTDQAVAWKQGYFNFEGMHLRDVMRMLERWYDIQVVYEGNVPDIAFVGELPRNTTLAELTRNMADVGVHFRIEAGKRLIIKP